METSTAFAAIALAAVSWDGTLTMAGTRSLRHSLDYRRPFNGFDDQAMGSLLNQLLQQLRAFGAQHMMIEAAEGLSSSQRATAYAVAAEIMRSDGPLVEDERNILANLAGVLELDETLSGEILRVMDVLHADLLAP